MSHPVKISVVMPVYNNEMYLQDSIESILNQTYGDFEFIIVDDSTSIQTKELLTHYAIQDRRISILTNQTNAGMYNARNKGIRAAKGKYIANMDEDDISLSNRFERQVQYLDHHPEIAVLGGQIIFVNSNGNEFQRSNYPLSPGLVRWGLIFGCQLANGLVMMHRELFSNESFYYGNSLIAEDFALWTRIGTHHKMANLPDYLYLYRIHGSNISIVKKSTINLESLNIISGYISDFVGEKLSDNLINGMISSKRIL